MLAVQLSQLRRLVSDRWAAALWLKFFSDCLPVIRRLTQISILLSLLVMDTALKTLWPMPSASKQQLITLPGPRRQSLLYVRRHVDEHSYHPTGVPVAGP